MFSTLFVPGYGNSTDGHWQEIWHKQMENSHWVEQDDWDNPECEKWVQSLNDKIQAISGPKLIIAHSLGGNTFIEWASKYSNHIIGAFLVAPPDVKNKNFPDVIKDYRTEISINLTIPSLIVASIDDPYSTIEETTKLAKKLGSDLKIVGKKGHINNDSNLGQWHEGKEILRRFIVSLGF